MLMWCEFVGQLRRDDHARESGHPVHTASFGVYWVPAFAGRQSCARLAWHIAHRKPRDALVVVRERAQLILRDVVVELAERPVAGQLLDLDVDEIGRVFAVGAHDPGGRLASRRLVGSQRIARIATAARHSASARASITLCAAPFEPRGYIGCAASPASVTRPKVQRSADPCRPSDIRNEIRFFDQLRDIEPVEAPGL